MTINELLTTSSTFITHCFELYNATVLLDLSAKYIYSILYLNLIIFLEFKKESTLNPVLY